MTDKLQTPPRLPRPLNEARLLKPATAYVNRRPELALVVALLALSCLTALTVACEPTSPAPDATATRQVTATTLSTATILPTSRTPAAVTPQLATGLRTVELDPEYRPVYPVYVDGQEYASVGPDDQLYLVNVETGQMKQITEGEDPIYQAAFSAGHVAWVDHRREIELPDMDSDPPFNYSDDIFVLDRATGEQRRITEAPAQRQALQISGDWLVWQDRRNETGQDYTNFDIYAYNLETGQEIPVAIAPGAQIQPAIHGNTVVWADNRYSPEMETTKAGCSNCPENRFDIYAFDLSTGEERVLVETGHLNQAPEINGKYLAWRAYDPENPQEIRLLDLESGGTRTMTQVEGNGSGPALSDEHLVWSSSWPCDVFPIENPDSNGVYAQDLATGETWKLSDYVETIAATSGNMVVISEWCWGRGPVYAAFLE